jgi:hypothetical protein
LGARELRAETLHGLAIFGVLLSAGLRPGTARSNGPRVSWSQDNGRSINPGDATQGFGLAGMRARRAHHERLDTQTLARGYDRRRPVPR